MQGKQIVSILWLEKTELSMGFLLKQMCQAIFKVHYFMILLVLSPAT